jgi:hypothetical protein
MSEQEAVGVGGGEMDRAHREDYELERACRDAARLIGDVLDADRAPTGFHWRNTLAGAQAMLKDEADRIVAVWD